MSGVSSVVEMILLITGDVRSRGTYKRKHTHLSFETIQSSCINQTNITHSIRSILCQITEQNSYAATNIEQDPHINHPHQQTSDIQDLKDMMKSLFEQMGTMIILLTTVLTELT
jgi:hypothetical protein